jgi:hypothetical protein
VKTSKYRDKLPNRSAAVLLADAASRPLFARRLELAVFRGVRFVEKP